MFDILFKLAASDQYEILLSFEDTILAYNRESDKYIIIYNADSEDYILLGIAKVYGNLLAVVDVYDVERDPLRVVNLTSVETHIHIPQLLKFLQERPDVKFVAVTSPREVLVSVFYYTGEAYDFFNLYAKEESGDLTPETGTLAFLFAANSPSSHLPPMLIDAVFSHYQSQKRERDFR